MTVTATSSSLFTTITADTDAQGHYSLGHLALIGWSITFAYNGTEDYPLWYFDGFGDPGSREPSSFTFSASDSDAYNVTVGAGAALDGTVRDSSGNPIAGIAVYASTIEPYIVDRGFEIGPSYTDANGHYRIRGVPPETGGSAQPQTDWAVSAGGEGWATSYAPSGDFFHFPTTVSLADGKPHLGLDIVLYRSVTVSGTIKALGSLPSGAELVFGLSYYDPATSNWIFRGQPVTSGVPYSTSVGPLKIGLLPPGTYKLSAGYFNGGTGYTALTTSPSVVVSEGATLDYSTTVSETPVSPGDISYVTALYHDFLSRDPSGSEIGFWTDALSIGLPRTSIAAGFVTSDEYRLIRIDDAYQSVLGRASDAQGRLWWLAAVKAGSLQIDDVAEHFYSSQEYVDAHQSNGESNVTRNWIHQLYMDLLHRAPDASGLNFWEAATVADGRQSVVDGLWDSQETAGARVSAMYASYLGRTPDPDGLVFWTHVDLTLGDSVARSSITASNEYYNLASTRYPAG